MANPARREATYADLEAVPPHLVAEIIFGTLVTHPRPTPKHGRAQLEIGLELANPYGRGRGGPGGWIFLPEPQLHLMSHVVVPDLAGWRSERLTPFPETAHISTEPDWVCEVLSDSTERYDRNEKRMIYGASGVPFLWLLDPRAGFLECFQLVAGQWLLLATFSGEDEVKAPPFEAVAFPVRNLWPPAPSSSPE